MVAARNVVARKTAIDAAQAGAVLVVVPLFAL